MGISSRSCHGESESERRGAGRAGISSVAHGQSPVAATPDTGRVARASSTACRAALRHGMRPSSIERPSVSSQARPGRRGGGSSLGRRPALDLSQRRLALSLSLSLSLVSLRRGFAPGVALAARQPRAPAGRAGAAWNERWWVESRCGAGGRAYSGGCLLAPLLACVFSWLRALAHWRQGRARCADLVRGAACTGRRWTGAATGAPRGREGGSLARSLGCVGGRGSGGVLLAAGACLLPGYSAQANHEPLPFLEPGPSHDPSHPSHEQPSCVNRRLAPSALEST